MPNYTLNIQTMRGTTAYLVEIFDENATFQEIMDYAISLLPPIRIKPDEEVFFYFADQSLYPEDSPVSAGIPDGGAIDIFIDSVVAAGPNRPVTGQGERHGFENSPRRVMDIEVVKRMAELDENKPFLAVKQLDNFHLEFTYRNMRGIRRLDPAGRPIIEDEFRVKVTLSTKYPIEKPTVDFIQPFSIYHPNVNIEKGNICYALNWNELAADLCYVAVQVSHIIQFEPRLVNLDVLDARMNENAKAWFESEITANTGGFPLSRVKLRNPDQQVKKAWKAELMQRIAEKFPTGKQIGPMPPVRRIVPGQPR
jgi:hypothetical protein